MSGASAPVRVDRLSNEQLRALNDQHNPAGWPRPRMPHISGEIFPAPWVMSVISIGGVVHIDFLEGDAGRDDGAENGACQVCGLACTEVLYAPALSGQLTQQSIEFNGHPLCSARCVQLTLRTCPYYSADPDAKVITFSGVHASYEGVHTVISTWTVL